MKTQQQAQMLEVVTHDNENSSFSDRKRKKKDWLVDNEQENMTVVWEECVLSSNDGVRNIW